MHQTTVNKPYLTLLRTASASCVQNRYSTCNLLLPRIILNDNSSEQLWARACHSQSPPDHSPGNLHSTYIVTNSSNRPTVCPRKPNRNTGSQSAFPRPVASAVGYYGQSKTDLENSQSLIICGMIMDKPPRKGWRWKCTGPFPLFLWRSSGEPCRAVTSLAGDPCLRYSERRVGDGAHFEVQI